MRIEWTPAALESAARFIADQPGMRALNRAVANLIDDPAPPEAFVRGDYRRLRVGSYRVIYTVGEDRITVLRVDRLS
jgi:mRNA-degrading endonuclease RelE of RelBE toxin-antitoxin system